MKNFLRLLLLLPFIAFSEERLYSSEISYGSNEKQKIDLYEGSSDKVLIWIHGGGWLFGDKRSERWIKRFHNHFIDHEKLNVYMIGYRVGEDTAPDAVNDVICAYKEIVDDAVAKNLSIDDIVVSGASAGGHLALMVGLSNEYKLEHSCNTLTMPKAVINLFGITEIEKTSKFLDENKFFSFSNYVKTWLPSDLGPEEASKNLSPINLISLNSPKVLTIHGAKDSWVPYDQAILLDKKLKDNHQLLTIENGGHYGFSDDEDQIIRLKISEFLRDTYND
ncbi:alpha/beta hydrolase [Gammaproteobacteria bacterium]|nr:alpha/beta hydrolase [Gammaproteobacteria bacterium]